MVVVDSVLPVRLTLGGVQRDLLDINGDYTIVRTNLWKGRPVWSRLVGADLPNTAESGAQEIFTKHSSVKSACGKLRRLLCYSSELSCWQVTSNPDENPVAIWGPDW